MSTDLIAKALKGMVEDTDTQTSFYRRNTIERMRVSERDRAARARKSQKPVRQRRLKLQPNVVYGSGVLQQILKVPKVNKRRRH